MWRAATAGATAFSLMFLVLPIVALIPMSFSTQHFLASEFGLRIITSNIGARADRGNQHRPADAGAHSGGMNRARHFNMDGIHVPAP